MNPPALPSYLLFHGDQMLYSGALLDIALWLQAQQTSNNLQQGTTLIFAAESGRQIDVDVSGTEKDIIERYQQSGSGGVDNVSDSVEQTAEPVGRRGRGRPKLGVVGKEVTLLPRHWQWLDQQRGGASAELRRLIEVSMKATASSHEKRQAQNRTYSFLSAIAGNLPDYEEATRALFNGQSKRFHDYCSAWPRDIRNTAITLADGAFPSS